MHNTISPSYKNHVTSIDTFIISKVTLIIGMFLIFSSCQKKNEISDTKNLDQEVIQQAAEHWLDSKKSKQPSDRNERVEQLRNNLDFESSFSEKAVDNETVFIIPIKKGFTSFYNKEKTQKQLLVLTIGITGIVRKGNVVQMASNSSSIPPNTFYSMETDGKVKMSGSLTFLTIFDRFLFKIEFKDGRQRSFTEARKGRKRETANEPISLNSIQTNDEVCTDW